LGTDEGGDVSTVALPVGLAVRQAELRKKRDGETFLEFFYSKINLLRNAYPQCGAEGYIKMVMAALDDPIVELWARETSDLARFAAELRQYDDHLAHDPQTTRKLMPGLLRCIVRWHGRRFGISCYDMGGALGSA